jgi:hypothetical protein
MPSRNTHNEKRIRRNEVTLSKSLANLKGNIAKKSIRKFYTGFAN